MRLALIPPLSLLTEVPNTGYHLMLPQLVNSSLYCQIFKLLACDLEQYVILDNGAAEGYASTPTDLIALAGAFNVDELVIPDVMADSTGTYEKIRNFFYALGNRPRTYKLGFVATGYNIPDAMNLTERVMEKFYDYIDVIYVPRLLVKGDDKFARIHFADDLQVFGKEIHFLGANPKFIREMQVAAGTGIVRGMDTSAPFNYTYHGAYLEHLNPFSRPDGYFSRPRSEFNQEILHHNIELALRWAQGS